jgi:hypothetical protein
MVTYPEVEFASDLSSSLEWYTFEIFENTDDVGLRTKQPTEKNGLKPTKCINKQIYI